MVVGTMPVAYSRTHEAPESASRSPRPDQELKSADAGVALIASTAGTRAASSFKEEGRRIRRGKLRVARVPIPGVARCPHGGKPHSRRQGSGKVRPKAPCQLPVLCARA